MRKHLPEAFMVAFALLISTTAAAAYAQMPPGMQQVSGTYANSEAGVSITFPDGWSGFALPAANGTVTSVFPGGNMDQGDSVKMIGLMILDKSSSRNLTDPGQYVQSDKKPECNTPSPTETTVSGKKAFEATVECTFNDKPTKIKMTMAESTDNLIVVMYMSPTADFDADVGKYDAAVDTLEIDSAVDATIPNIPAGGGGSTGGGSMQTQSMQVTVAGSPINVSVQSASTISAFAVNEASKMLSFKADGNGDKTVVSVGSVLQGPYTVMVDGQATSDFQESTDASGMKTVTVPHASGSHQVSITGTQVVPEFPFALLGLVAAMVAVITVAGRSRLFKGSL